MVPCLEINLTMKYKCSLNDKVEVKHDTVRRAYK